MALRGSGYTGRSINRGYSNGLNGNPTQLGTGSDVDYAGAREILQERREVAEEDPRYHNADGSKKSVAEIKQGFAQDEAATRASSERNKMVQFSQLADEILKSKKNEDGSYTLSDKSVGRLASVYDDFPAINNNINEFRFKEVDGNFRLLADGEDMNLSNTRADVFMDSAKTGNLITQQEGQAFNKSVIDGLSNKSTGKSKTKSTKFTDERKQRIKNVQDQMKYLDSQNAALVENGLSADDPRVQEMMQSRVKLRGQLRDLTSGTTKSGLKAKDYSGLKGKPSSKKGSKISRADMVRKMKRSKEKSKKRKPVMANQGLSRKGRKNIERTYYRDELTPEQQAIFDKRNEEIDSIPNQIRGLSRKGRRSANG